MRLRHLVLSTSAALLVAGCESGDINLTPTTVDNSVDNSTSGGGGGATNPCASYEEAGQTQQGAYDGTHCTYDSLFVGDTRPLTVSSVTFPALPNGGFHIFEDSLYIGEDVSATAAATGKRIPQEGEGTRVTIAAGSTMVFETPDSYVRIARGSQIFAEGTATSPITFTADEDAILGTADETDRGLWGGVQINGNGITNKCSDGTATGLVTGRNDFAATANNVHNCHVTSEGRPATYGGNNNAESSGALRYVVIKHAGFEVVDGDELNALTLNAVGSGTTISHVETYTTQDDGFEMFGGAVNMDHIVAVNVGDDSIDYSEGYVGDIQYAVVVHTSGANRCIEGDNTGENRPDGMTPTTLLRISNLTCVTSNVASGAGTSPSGKGDSEGPLFREGAYFELYNSIVTSNETTMQSKECLEIEDTEGPETIDAAEAGTSIAISNLVMCSEAVKTGIVNAANAGFDFATWLATAPNADNVIESTNIPGSIIVGGVGTRGYLTAPLLTDSVGGQITVPIYDVSALGGIFERPAYLGGASEADDWLAGWTVGLSDPLVP